MDVGKTRLVPAPDSDSRTDASVLITAQRESNALPSSSSSHLLSLWLLPRTELAHTDTFLQDHQLNTGLPLTLPPPPLHLPARANWVTIYPHSQHHLTWGGVGQVWDHHHAVLAYASASWRLWD